MEPWKFEINTFLSVTLRNYKLFDIILRDHVGRLTKLLQKSPGDVALTVMLGRASSALSVWIGVYNPYRAARGVYKARTQTLYELLALLPAQLDDWDISIQGAGGPGRPFKAGKPGYTELFPQGRAPFTSGAVDQRIAALETLVLNLTPHAVLEDVRAEVEVAAGLLRAARDTQTQEEGGVDADSSAVEAARVAGADAMFRNAGRGMEKYGASPMVGKLFDLVYVRDGAPPPPDGAPGAPQGLTLSTVSGQPAAAGLAWDLLPEATGYNIYRQLPGETGWTRLAENVTDAMAVLAGQPVGVVLTFAITGLNAAGEGPRSVPEEITL